MKYLLLIILLFFPFITAWGWQAHPASVQELIYTLDIGNKLDFDSLGNGSIAPDRDFKDNVRHHYPPAYNQTLYWLEKTKQALNVNDYKQASYSFGVASHYVTDSFSAPHYIKKELYKDHAKYEHQIDNNYLKVECKKEPYDIDLELQKATQKGLTWKEWLETKNPVIPQKAFQESSRLVYLIALDVFNANCLSKITEYEKSSFLTTKNIIAAIIIGILILILIISILREEH